jgi:hypothetical protein
MPSCPEPDLASGNPPHIRYSPRCVPTIRDNVQWDKSRLRRGLGRGPADSANHAAKSGDSYLAAGPRCSHSVIPHCTNSSSPETRVLVAAWLCLGANYGIEWAQQPNVTSLVVGCNDTLTLSWAGKHNIARSTLGMWAACCSGSVGIAARRENYINCTVQAAVQLLGSTSLSTQQREAPSNTTSARRTRSSTCSARYVPRAISRTAAPLQSSAARGACHGQSALATQLNPALGGRPCNQQPLPGCRAHAPA